MILIDSHCHLQYENSDFVLMDELMKQCNRESLRFLLNVATKGSDSMNFIKSNFSNKVKGIYSWNNIISLAFSVGYHPTENYAVDYEYLLSIGKESLAIGETGFDLGINSPATILQEENFQKHLSIANILQIPLIIHCRDAWSLLKANLQGANGQVPHIIHCFTGDLSVAKELLNRNCLISISGIATYKPAESIREAIAYIPMDRLILETDSPFLTPYNKRKSHKLNNPSFIVETAEKVAEIKKISLEEVASLTTKNFLNFFQLNLDDY